MTTEKWPPDWFKPTERCEHGYITKMGDDADCTCDDGDENCIYRDPACPDGCPDWRDQPHAGA